MPSKKFKLIQDYPGSPEVGYTINSGNSMYYSYKPELFPHLWEEINCEITIMTNDGILLGLGEEYYTIYDYEHIKTNNVSEYGIQCSLRNNHEKIFSTRKAAERYLNDSIDLELMDEKIIGENITIYGVCDGSFQTSEMSSLKMYKKLYGNKTTGHISDKWKWFKNENNRTEYIKWNKPIYSLNNIKDRLEMNGQFVDEQMNK